MSSEAFSIWLVVWQLHSQSRMNILVMVIIRIQQAMVCIIIASPLHFNFRSGTRRLPSHQYWFTPLFGSQGGGHISTLSTLEQEGTGSSKEKRTAGNMLTFIHTPPRPNMHTSRVVLRYTATSQSCQHHQVMLYFVIGLICIQQPRGIHNNSVQYIEL